MSPSREWRSSHRRGRVNEREGHSGGASADEARRPEDRRRGRVRLPDGADRRSRRGRHRLGRRFGRRQHVGTARASWRSRSTRCCSPARRSGGASNAHWSAAISRTVRCRKARRLRVRAATRLVEEGGADMLKLDAAADHPDAVRAVARRGHSGVGAVRHHAAHGEPIRRDVERVRTSWPHEMTEQFVAEAKLLEEAGASLLDFTHSGPVAGPAVDARGVDSRDRRPGRRPLAGWTRSRSRQCGRLLAAALDDTTDRYANVARDHVRRDTDVRRRRARGAPDSGQVADAVHASGSLFSVRVHVRRGPALTGPVDERARQLACAASRRQRCACSRETAPRPRPGAQMIPCSAA